MARINIVMVVAYCSQKPSRIVAKQSTVDRPWHLSCIWFVMSVLYTNRSECRYDWTALATSYSVLKALLCVLAQASISARSPWPAAPTWSAPWVYLCSRAGG